MQKKQVGLVEAHEGWILATKLMEKFAGEISQLPQEQHATVVTMLIGQLAHLLERGGLTREATLKNVSFATDYAAQARDPSTRN